MEDHRPCKNDCGFMGTIETGYYCSQCYRKRTGSVGGLPGDPPQGRGDVVFSRNSDSKDIGEQPEPCTSCRSFFGSFEYGGLCHTCFMAKTASPEPPPPDLCKRCRQYFGNEEFGGYCNECFLAMTREQTVGLGRLDHPDERSRDYPPLDNNPPYEVMQPSGILPHPTNPPQDIPRPLHHPSGVEGHVYEDPDMPIHSTRPPMDHRFDRVGSSNNLSTSHPPVIDPVLQKPPDPIPGTRQPPVPVPRRPRKQGSVNRTEPQSLPKPLPDIDTARFDTLSINQSCFICDPSQPIQLLNAVCQQHAKTIRETYKMTADKEVVTSHVPHHTAPVTHRPPGAVDQHPSGRGEVSVQFPVVRDNQPRVGGHLGRGSVTGYHGNLPPASTGPRGGIDHHGNLPPVTTSPRGRIDHHGNLPPVSTGPRGGIDHHGNLPPSTNNPRGGIDHHGVLPSSRQMTEPIQQSMALRCCNIGCGAPAKDVFGGFCENCYGEMSKPKQGGGAIGGGGANGGGGAIGGASGTAGSHPPSDEVKPPKMLCRTPGCSFYPLSGLNGYCKDCFAGKK